jgi:hypothetical protein
MTEVRTSSLCERPCAGIEDTLEASIGTGGHSVFDAAMAPTQESGLRENCTSRLSERAEGGRKPHLPRLYVCLTVDASGGFKSRSARGPGPISEGGGNASPAGEDGRYGEATEAQRRKPGNR